MTYWLVNAGTSSRPLRSGAGGVRIAFATWRSANGSVIGVDRRYGMRRGDLLIYRSVGTPVSRLVAVGRVLGPPQPLAVLQWPFRVPVEHLAVVDTLRDGPAFGLLETAPVRVTKRLDDGTGARAVDLLERATGSATGTTGLQAPGHRRRALEDRPARHATGLSSGP